jgi:hypothetical protein
MFSSAGSSLATMDIPTQPERAAARKPTARRVAVLAPLALVISFVAAACGGGSSKPTATTSSPSTSAAAAPAGSTGSTGAGRGAALNSQLAAFRSCMAAQGEPLPTFAPRSSTSVPAGETPSTGGGGGGRGFGGGGFFAGGGGGGLGIFLRGLNQNDPKVMAAYNACKSQIPASILQQQQQRSQALTAFDSCMKDHGVTIPTGPPAAGTTRTTIDQSSAAYQTCKVLLPNGGVFGPGPSTSSNGG